VLVLMKMSNENKFKILAILGPTAIGKTEIAIRLAKAFDGEVISCDSVQIYKRLDIGSAKPKDEELNSIKYHMLSLFKPSFQVDVGLYKKIAERTILDVNKREKLPIVAGGTGMYFNSLYYGLFEGPGRDEALRRGLEERIRKEGLLSLYEELRMKDPKYAEKVQPGDKRRIVRALEVYYKTGTPFSNLHLNNKKLPLDWFLIGLNMERKELYERIEVRVDRMIKEGLIDETRSIMETYGENAFALGSIGYRHARDYILGKIDKEEMISLLKKDTRHYAKRQITWFRKIKGINWFNPLELDKIMIAVKDFLYGEKL